jgi:hypothetical protein
MLPPSVVDLFDLELEEMVIIVDEVRGPGADSIESIGCLPSPTSHEELVVTRTGKAVENTAGLTAQVPPLRRPGTDRYEQRVNCQDRGDWVKARTEVGAHGRQVHQTVFLPERPSSVRHLRSGVRKLSPDCHPRQGRSLLRDRTGDRRVRNAGSRALGFAASTTKFDRPQPA